MNMEPQDITDERYEYGVIDPNGHFYACHYEGHNWLAQFLQRRGVIPENRDEYNYFEEEGWIKLTGAMLTKCEFMFEFNPQVRDSKTNELIRISKSPTGEQIEAIVKYKESRNQKELNFNFNDYSLVDFLKEAKEDFAYYKEK